MQQTSITDQISVLKLSLRCGTKSLYLETSTHRVQQNNHKAVVKGKSADRRGGYGLEVSWECHFTGDKSSILWLNSILGNEGFEFKLI